MVRRYETMDMGIVYSVLSYAQGLSGSKDNQQRKVHRNPLYRFESCPDYLKINLVGNIE